MDREITIEYEEKAVMSDFFVETICFHRKLIGGSLTSCLGSVIYG